MAMLDLVDDGGDLAAHSAVPALAEDLGDPVGGEPPKPQLTTAPLCRARHNTERFLPGGGPRPSQQAQRLMAPVGEKRVGRNRVQALAAGRDRQPMGIEWGSWFGAAE